MLRLDFSAPSPMHADYVHEISVFGKLRSVRRHVVAVPALGQG
jgi:hypothetical protein